MVVVGFFLEKIKPRIRTNLLYKVWKPWRQRIAFLVALLLNMLLKRHFISYIVFTSDEGGIVEEIVEAVCHGFNT